MQRKGSGLTVTALTMLLLASCATKKNVTAPPQTETKPVVTEVIPFIPTPEPPPATPPTPAPLVPPAVNPADLPPAIIAWDSADKSVSVNFGEPMAKFQFALTNVSDAPVTVLAVTSSCGCTAAQVPPMPWIIAPGVNASFAVNMNLAGKNGTIIKTVTVASDKGTKHLLVRTTMEPMTNALVMAPGSREQNQLIAKADRQAVFKGDCASCHVEKAKGKTGRELYVAACGICHDAEHRAAMVTDLKVPRGPRDLVFWQKWIMEGKPGTMMPAFAHSHGGPLTQEQVDSLTTYCFQNFPKGPQTANSTPTAVTPPVAVPTPAKN